MKLFLAIAMCSVAWADVTNLGTLITNCSDDSRTARLQALQRNLRRKEINIEGYERVLGLLVPKMEAITRVILEHRQYQVYARKFLQMPFLLGAVAEIKKSEGPESTVPAGQITIKQLMDNVLSAIYVLPEIILAIEVLEKDLESNLFKELEQRGELFFREVPYEEFVGYLKFLSINKIILLSMMKDLQDIRTPLADLTTESTRCSTRQVYELSGMTYVP